MDRARTGDRDAFGILYDRYSGSVFRYVLTHVYAQALAEDLTSETFLRAFRQIKVFTWRDKDFDAWLVTIARNLITDYYRSGRYRLEVCTSEVTDVPLDETHIPENEIIDAAVRGTLLDAVQSLGAEQRQCLVLRFLHELSLAETAMIMGKTPGAVKALQHRAVRSLARLLPEDLSRIGGGT